jgi:hypothetical protein
MRLPKITVLRWLKNGLGSRHLLANRDGFRQQENSHQLLTHVLINGKSGDMSDRTLTLLTARILKQCK